LLLISFANFNPRKGQHIRKGHLHDSLTMAVCFVISHTHNTFKTTTLNLSLAEKQNHKQQKTKQLSMQPSYCVKENKPCVGWVQNYFSDCLCNVNDNISFTFGFISLICWGVAEIPQIITNFRAKSSHGVSIVFLLTWVAGLVYLYVILINLIIFFI
jgi:hypothetical protein